MRKLSRAAACGRFVQAMSGASAEEQNNQREKEAFMERIRREEKETRKDSQTPGEREAHKRKKQKKKTAKQEMSPEERETYEKTKMQRRRAKLEEASKQELEMSVAAASQNDVESATLSKDEDESPAVGEANEAESLATTLVTTEKLLPLGKNVARKVFKTIERLERSQSSHRTGA